MYVLIIPEHDTGALIQYARGHQEDMQKLARRYPGSMVVKEA